ncbi:MAG: DUF2922 domain-containing protein [Firmicutes bacterium]|nr:DUF2922 domain-containing protein [Bacillota bacterium]
MSATLQMRFTNENGGRVTVSVPDPRTDLTGTEVKTAMDNIVAKNVFTSKGGNLVAVDSARIVSRDVTEVTLV